MKILNDYDEIRDKNNFRMQMMCAMVSALGSEGVEESLSQGLDLLHDNLPAHLFIQLGFQAYLVRTGQEGNPGEVYDEIKALLKIDVTETIEKGYRGEKALERARMPFPFLALTLGIGSVMGFIVHNKIQLIKESN